MMIEIKPMTIKDMPMLWLNAYSQDNPKWARLNAPYFEEYKETTYDEFLLTEAEYLLQHDHRQGIFLDDEIIGMVSYYWESKPTRWMEVGIVIYNEIHWGKGIGSSTLRFWLDHLFAKFPEIERLGFTTWSGNPGMIQIGEKLNMTQEALIRKVRYFEGEYYDSVKYGILRSEWDAL